MKHLNGFVIKDKERYLDGVKAVIEGLDEKKYIKYGCKFCTKMVQ